MRCGRLFSIFALWCATLLFVCAAWANEPPTPRPPKNPRQAARVKAAQAAGLPKNFNTPVEQFEHMSPEQRERALSRLPPERRAIIERRLEQYERLGPEQRARLQQQYQRLLELPPERQQEVRRSMRRLLNQPPERQQAMRAELGRLRNMPAADREAYFDSPEFRSRYRPNEQEILRGMSGMFP